jgi:zinc protease
MKKINRTLEPKFQDIKPIKFIKPKKQFFSNNIPLYSIDAGDQDIVKVDFIFEAGDWFQQKALVAASTISLLQEGSKSYSSETIAEKLDFMGSYIYFNTSKHTATISVYCLNKHFEETILIIEDVIKNPIFPEEKIQTYIQKKFQHYNIEAQKVEVISQKKFSHVIFGKQHPYGISPEPEEFLKLSQIQLKEFHKQYYNSDNCKIIIAGKIKSMHYEVLKQHFGTKRWNILEIIKPIPDYIITPSEIKKHNFPKEDAVQSAIRVGKLLVNKYNPDYPALQVLNTILGGYFGSRLMSNIREDKGYTYGIGSGIVSHRTAGYFVIVSQVGKEVCGKALDEVYFELKRLRTETIPNDELETVKNYMLATIARNFDGAFALSDSFKTILEYELGYEYYKQFWKVVNKITSSELKNLANTYLDEGSMYEIIAG